MTTSTNNETRYKFVVSSAEEAVKVLRERLGENAKVISVRQVEGGGLARFLRAPKLEVIAQVEEPAQAPVIEEPAPLSAPVQPTPASEIEAAAPVDDLSRILRRGGLTEIMLGRLKSSEEWARICRHPMREALIEVAVLLRTQYQSKPKAPVEGRVAFIGTAGVGKTTALCKRLAMEVFFKRRRAVVLKVDMDKGNPSDGLAVFCEVLGVPMVRSLESIPPLAPDQTLYIDFPGIAPDNRKELDEVSQLLSELSASSRVLVVNSAYEIGLIKNAYRMGASLSATHVVFTHLDELMQWGKLWEFVVARELTPLFLSSGQNIAGDFNESVFDGILEKSFPIVGKETAMKADAL